MNSSNMNVSPPLSIKIISMGTTQCCHCNIPDTSPLSFPYLLNNDF